MSTESEHRTDRYFTGIIVILAIFLIVIGCQLYSQHTREKETTAAILQAQTEYFTLQHQKFDLLAKNDTLKKHPDLYAAYAKALRAEVSRDSVAWKSGTEAAMRDVKSLVEIHLQSIERQYDTLTLWAAVLTIVFLIFNFYSIFKLESTLAEAKSQFAKLDSEVLNQMDRIKDEATEKVKAIVEESEKQREKSQLFSDALRAQEQKEYEKAIEYYLQYLKLDTESTAAYNNLGNAYADKKEYDKAIESYLKAIEIDPQRADVYYNLGIIYNNKKEYDKAIEAYLKATKIEPQRADTYINLGVVYNNKKEYDRAIESYLKATKIEPQRADTYINLGVVYNNKEEYNKAIECYNKAIEIDPQRADAYNNLGNTYYQKEEYDKAIEYYNKAIEIDPKHAAVYNNLGNAYSDKKEYDKAIEYYLQYLKLDPESIDAYYNLGIIYANKKEYNKAIEYYNKAIEIESNNASAHHNLGVVYMDIKDWENAEKHLNQALALRPGYEKTIKAIAELKKRRAADKPGKD